MKKNSRENALVQVMLDNQNTELSLELLADAYYGERSRPKEWRNSLLGTLRRVSIKLENDHLRRGGQGPLILRTSSLGRSCKATFKLLS